ncbi:hypothetical protein [Anaerovorax sp. IOR16]|uniref:hypothetical protein n=1 Tax=Anaerovorax sp. IOR16 TaxID=2773458 RepID=UPI0019D02593|nr:hypothetical protein [Anaerovorax sp. IOR16]
MKIDINVVKKLEVCVNDEEDERDDYFEFVVDDGIEITIKDGRIYCGNIEEIMPNSILIMDEDRGSLEKIKFKDIVEINEY